MVEIARQMSTDRSRSPRAYNRRDKRSRPSRKVALDWSDRSDRNLQSEQLQSESRRNAGDEAITTERAQFLEQSRPSLSRACIFRPRGKRKIIARYETSSKRNARDENSVPGDVFNSCVENLVEKFGCIIHKHGEFNRVMRFALNQGNSSRNFEPSPDK